VKTSLLGHIKHPYTEKLRDAIRKHVDSYSKSIAKASSGLMHLAREMYEQVTHMETVEIPGEFFDKTSFRYLMHGTAGTWRENVLMYTLHENFAVFRFEGARHRGDSHIYTYGAMKYITNLKNHLTENLDHEPEEPFDREPRMFHDTHRVCTQPGHLSQGDMVDHQWHHERSPA